MAKRPTNLTLDEGVLEYAAQIMQARRFPNLVSLVEQLLREEFERRNGPVNLQDAPHHPVPSNPKPVNYRKRARSRAVEHLKTLPPK